eukprot:TRINITY_DN1892_c1_g1_i5.p1 TRINITY_DN1892_c1_g1~~TRINITY_DN1892_c1_g1_i5.p1  ORF type:complete len:412 (+),score=80.54 TRINITY_DN1892_c1_g1_i5:64-1299(+)
MSGHKKRMKCEPKWAYAVDNGWQDFAEEDAALIEKLYQGKTKVVATTDLSFNKKHKSIYEFDFKKMTQTNKDSNNKRKIKRIDPTDMSDDSDDDSDEESDDEPKFIWEHQDNFGVWVALYEEDNDLVESFYQKKSKSNNTFVTKDLTFNKGYNSLYTFNFAKMTQMNHDSGKIRNIRRSKNAPKAWNVKNYGVKKESKKALADMKLSGNVLDSPSTWTPAKNPGGCDLVPVASSSKEYKRVLEPFFKTIGGKPTIKSLTRIQNYQLWPFYALNRDKIERKNKGVGGANEMFLFHGTRVKANMDCIVNAGFDTRVAANGLCGTGTYFAVNASYSDSGYVYRHPDGSKEMLVCRVLVGRYAVKQGNDRRPPPLDPKKPNGGLYDSVVDNTGNPIMHVVFYDHQAIPEYIIHYK